MIFTGRILLGTSATLILSVPPGACSITLTGGTLVTFYGGTEVSSVGTGTGAHLPAGALVTVPCYPTSTGGALYGAAPGTTVAISYTLSTPM